MFGKDCAAACSGPFNALNEMIMSNKKDGPGWPLLVATADDEHSIMTCTRCCKWVLA